jgi:hypothetical protein
MLALVAAALVPVDLDGPVATLNRNDGFINAVFLGAPRFRSEVQA